MNRRTTRERREYIYRKSLQSQEHALFEKKQAIKAALAAGKGDGKGKGTAGLPTELRADARGSVGRDLVLDEAQREPGSNIDDEYSRVGLYDPKVVITTSRDPSSRLLQFAKELRLVFPNASRINRGNYVIKELVEACRANEVTDLLMVHEHRGVPDALIITHLPHGPTLSLTLHNVTLRHDIASHATSTVSEQYPHLIFDNFSSKLGGRIKGVLGALFPVPKEDAKRVMTFANEEDFISFRHHVFVKNSHKDVQLAEVGPRFEAKPYEIRLGTVDQSEADVEWLLRPYQRTAKKRNML